MTAYEGGLPVEVAFRPEEARSLAHAASDAGWRQFHVAETEKYAHVTYFFNGGREAPLPGEDRRLVPEPEGRDLRPPAGDERGRRDRRPGRRPIASDAYDLIVANFANPDMVGHTGVWDAAVAGGRDGRCLPRPDRGRPRRARRGGPGGPGACSRSRPTTATPTQMRDARRQPVTAHSLNPVPFLAGRAGRRRAGRSTTACSPTSRPTLLELAGLPRWAGMTGRSLLDSPAT